MAYIAIVYVPDDHTADAIVSGELGVSRWGRGVRFVGLFRYPTRDDLQCDGTCTGRGSRAHSVRDEDGRMVCSQCGSQHKAIRHLLLRALYDYLGRNLFDNAPKAFNTNDFSR